MTQTQKAVIDAADRYERAQSAYDTVRARQGIPDEGTIKDLSTALDGLGVAVREMRGDCDHSFRVPGDMCLNCGVWDTQEVKA
jgi:hypothetical protein